MKKIFCYVVALLYILNVTLNITIKVEAATTIMPYSIPNDNSSYSSDFNRYDLYDENLSPTESSTVELNSLILKPNETYSFKSDYGSLATLNINTPPQITTAPTYDYCIYTNTNAVERLGTSTSPTIGSLNYNSITKITNKNPYSISITWSDSYNFTYYKNDTPAVISVTLNDKQSISVLNNVQVTSPITYLSSSILEPAKIDIAGLFNNKIYKLFPNYVPNYNPLRFGQDITLYLSPANGSSITIFLPYDYKEFYQVLNTPAIKSYTLQKDYYLEINNPARFDIYTKISGDKVNLNSVLTYNTNTNNNSKFTQQTKRIDSYGDYRLFSNNVKLALNNDSPTTFLFPGILDTDIKILPGNIVKSILLKPNEVLHITNMNDKTVIPIINSINKDAYSCLSTLSDQSGNITEFYNYKSINLYNNIYRILSYIGPNYNGITKNTTEKSTLEVILPLDDTFYTYVNSDETFREITLKAGSSFSFKNVNRKSILLSNIQELGVKLNYKSTNGYGGTNSNELKLEADYDYTIFGDSTKDIKFYLPTKLLEPSTTNILDVNYDNIVDIYDLSTVASKNNVDYRNPKYSIKCDFNKDYYIDIYDIIYLSKRIF